MYTSSLDKKKELENAIIDLQKQKIETAKEVDLEKEVKIYYKFSILNETKKQDNNENNIKNCINF